MVRVILIILWQRTMNDAFSRNTVIQSVFLSRRTFVFVGKTNDDESCSQKNCIQQSTLFSHQARGKDYVKVY